MEQEIHVPRDPQEILVRPDNQVAYVSCDQSKQVAVIDLFSWRVEKLAHRCGSGRRRFGLGRQEELGFSLEPDRYQC